MSTRDDLEHGTVAQWLAMRLADLSDEIHEISEEQDLSPITDDEENKLLEAKSYVASAIEDFITACTTSEDLVEQARWKANLPGGEVH